MRLPAPKRPIHIILIFDLLVSGFQSRPKRVCGCKKSCERVQDHNTWWKTNEFPHKLVKLVIKKPDFSTHAASPAVLCQKLLECCKYSLRLWPLSAGKFTKFIKYPGRIYCVLFQMLRTFFFLTLVFYGNAAMLVEKHMYKILSAQILNFFSNWCFMTV